MLVQMKHSWSNQNCTDRFVCTAKQENISNTLATGKPQNAYRDAKEKPGK